MSEAALKKSAVRARLNIIKRYENGWMPKAGRCKKYKHISCFVGSAFHYNKISSNDLLKV